jgi:hypothetical protein
MARIGRDGPTDRTWRATVVLGLAPIAGAFAFALLYPSCSDPAHAGTRTAG